MKVKCYCDGSYGRNIAIAGWMIGNNNIRYKYIKNTTCFGAELHAIIELLKELLNKSDEVQYIIYTDSLSMINRIENRKHLIDNNYCSVNGKISRYRNLYRELFKLIDNDLIEIKHIRGHSKNHEKTKNDIQFAKVDKGVRKKLRYLIKHKKNDNPSEYL
jgi:ribonuclease HI